MLTSMLFGLLRLTSHCDIQSSSINLFFYELDYYGEVNPQIPCSKIQVVENANKC